MIKLFGFTFGDKGVVQVQNPNESSFALPTNAIDYGAVTITGKKRARFLISLWII